MEPDPSRRWQSRNENSIIPGRRDQGARIHQHLHGLRSHPSHDGTQLGLLGGTRSCRLPQVFVRSGAPPAEVIPDESRSSADQGDQVRCVASEPTDLGLTR